MVNNAGVETRTSVRDTTEDQYDRVMNITRKSAFFIIPATQHSTRQAALAGRQPQRREDLLELARVLRVVPRQR